MSLRMLKTCRATLAGLLVAVALPAMAEDLQMWERSGGNQSHGRAPDCGVERKESRPADQDDPDPIARDGAETRAGHRFGRGAGSHGHGPHLRSAVRSCRTARRHHRPGQGLAGAQDGEPRPHDGVDLQGPHLRRAALCRRFGPLLEQAAVQGGGPRSRGRTAEPRRDQGDGEEDHGRRGRRFRLLPRRQLRRLQHLHLRAADLGLGRNRGADKRDRRTSQGRRR